MNEKFEAFKAQYEIMLSRREEGPEVGQVHGPFDPRDSLSEDFRALGGQQRAQPKDRQASPADFDGLTPRGRFEENLEVDPFSESEEGAPQKH